MIVYKQKIGHSRVMFVIKFHLLKLNNTVFFKYKWLISYNSKQLTYYVYAWCQEFILNYEVKVCKNTK